MHQQTCKTEKQDGAPKPQAGDRVLINAGVHFRRTESALSVPEKSAHQCIQKHHGEGDAHGDAEKHNQ